MRAPFQVTKRTYKGSTSFYARFQNADGTVIKEIKLPKAKSRTAAALEAKRLLDLGIIPKDENPLILTYIEDFWSQDSLYVRYRARHGLQISKRYIDDSRAAVLSRFGKILKGKTVSELSPLMVEKGIDALDRAGVGPRSINIALQALKVPIGWYAKMHRIPNPLLYVYKVKEDTRECSSLSPLEVSKLIGVTDDTLRARCAVLLGALCGLRLGEIRGLQWDDIDFVHHQIKVDHNVPSESKEVKEPKWGSNRVVPLPAVLETLLPLLRAIPGSSPLFVISNQADADQPANVITITRALTRMLKKIGIDKDQKRERHLTVHSLRHTFITLSRLGGTPDFLVQRLAGHRSAQMMERYTHAKNVIDYNAALTKFQKVIDDAASGGSEGRSKEEGKSAVNS